MEEEMEEVTAVVSSVKKIERETGEDDCFHSPAFKMKREINEIKTRNFWSLHRRHIGISGQVKEVGGGGASGTYAVELLVSLFCPCSYRWCKYSWPDQKWMCVSAVALRMVQGRRFSLLASLSCSVGKAAVATIVMVIVFCYAFFLQSLSCLRFHFFI